ncbi:MAG: hypothetical protein QG551_419 [Patescibacteria group bacterium]|nr:hypothetical protein [Patescibacteria group bacterium]
MSKPTDRTLELVYKLQKAAIKRALLKTGNFTSVQEKIQVTLCSMGIPVQESHEVSTDLTREASDELRSDGISPFIQTLED